MFFSFFYILYLFIKNAYPKKEELEELSQALGLSKFRIQNWFKYQRQKDFKIIQSPVYFFKNLFKKNENKILFYYFFFLFPF